MLAKEEIIHKLTDLFRPIKEIELAYLFGSTISEKVSELSDIDVAVYLNEAFDLQSNWRWRIKLTGQIMDALKSNRVDLVILNESPVLLQYEVLKNGILLKSQNETNRMLFFTKTVKEFCDTVRLREFHIAAAEERVKQGVKRGSSRGFAESLERTRRLFSKTSGV